MKTFKFFIICLLSIKFVNAQTGVYLADIQGKPILESGFTNVTGSPFLLEDYTIGSVTLIDSTVYDFVPLKFNILTNELFFKDSKSDAMLSFVDPVKSFKIGLDSYESGFPKIDNLNESTFYQILYNGNIKLLYRVSKYIVEYKPYNSATTEKKFEQIKSYYILKSGKMRSLKPSKKDLLETFGDKSSEIEAFLKKEKVDFKNNSDLAKVFEYYSSL